MTSGVEYVFLETHNWGRTVKFWMELGFRVELDLGHSGRLVHPSGGTALFVEEVPEGRPLGMRLYLAAPAAGVKPGPPAVVPGEWQASHWGSQLLDIRDPDGRTVVLQHRAAAKA